jgi:DNA-binding beta-propeller fold protein YncE
MEERMRRAAVLVSIVGSLAGCTAHVQRAPLPPLSSEEGSVYVYLDALPPDASRLLVDIESVSLARTDGEPVPLEVALPELSADQLNGQRLFALGRAPAGAYAGLIVKVKRARLLGEGGASDLLVPKEPTRVVVPFQIARRKALLVSLSLRHGESVEGGYAFAGQFASATSGNVLTQLAGFCPDANLAHLAMFNRHSRRILAILATGAQPRGLALDSAGRRGYVALAGEDQIQVLDLVTGDDLLRLHLRPGDRPREVQLTSGERVLVVVNQGSSTVSFVDVGSGAELGRVRTGEDPIALLLDRSEQRGYVFNRATSSISVVDVTHRALVQTVSTEAEPLRGAFNRTGDRLYVVYGGSAYMTVFSLPGMTVLSRIYVGLGTSAVRIDPRTDLVYVASRLDARLQIFDPFSTMPISWIDLPDAASYLTLDETENTLLALLPDRRAVAFVDLSSAKVISLVDVGRDPYFIAFVGERR